MVQPRREVLILWDLWSARRAGPGIPQEMFENGLREK
jgi:hypothetical protein